MPSINYEKNIFTAEEFIKLLYDEKEVGQPYIPDKNLCNSWWDFLPEGKLTKEYIQKIINNRKLNDIISVTILLVSPPMCSPVPHHNDMVLHFKDGDTIKDLNRLFF